MPKCLRCGAGGEWIEGRVPKSESQELRRLVALAEGCLPALKAYEERIADGCDIGDAEAEFAGDARRAIKDMLRPNARNEGAEPILAKLPLD